MKGILISSEQIEWFIDMLCNSYGKEDVKDRILGALEMVLTEEQENYCFDFVLTDFGAERTPCCDRAVAARGVLVVFAFYEVIQFAQRFSREFLVVSHIFIFISHEPPLVG